MSFTKLHKDFDDSMIRIVCVQKKQRNNTPIQRSIPVAVVARD